MTPRHVFVFVLTVILAVASAAPLSAQEAARFHVTGSVGIDASRDARLVDRSCDAAPLLNFFGCQPGGDGRQLGAPGDFGSSASVELAGGVRAFRWLRLEGAVAHRPDLDFDGNATFLNTGDEQPVSASGTATSVMARAIIDVGAIVAMGAIEPFVSVGGGRVRNRLSAVAYEFPGLASQPATTATVGGVRWDRAWDVSTGAGVRVASRSIIEGAYRYSDLGRVATGDGAIDVVRGDRQRSIENVAGTHARLRTNGFYVALRQEF